MNPFVVVVVVPFTIVAAVIHWKGYHAEGLSMLLLIMGERVIMGEYVEGF